MTTSVSEWTIGRVSDSAHALPSGFTFKMLCRAVPDIGTASLRRSMRILCDRGIFDMKKDGAYVTYYKR